MDPIIEIKPEEGTFFKKIEDHHTKQVKGLEEIIKRYKEGTGEYEKIKKELDRLTRMTPAERYEYNKGVYIEGQDMLA